MAMGIGFMAGAAAGAAVWSGMSGRKTRAGKIINSVTAFMDSAADVLGL